MVGNGASKRTTIRFSERTLAILDRYAGPATEGGRTALVKRLAEDYDARQRKVKARAAALAGRTVHDLKCWPEDFAAVERGDKTHEARRDDRGFAVGHVLRLREWRPDDPAACQGDATTRIPGKFTGRTLDVLVTHITRGQYGLPPDLAIMSVQKNGGAA